MAYLLEVPLRSSRQIAAAHTIDMALQRERRGRSLDLASTREHSGPVSGATQHGLPASLASDAGKEFPGKLSGGTDVPDLASDPPPRSPAGGSGSSARAKELTRSRGMLQTELLGRLPEEGSDGWSAPVRPPREKVLPELRPSMKPGELISEILKTNPGVFLGDKHGSFAIPEFLSNSMSSFRDSGVKRLYAEMFNSDDRPMLDRFWAQGDNRQDLVAYLKMKGWNNKAEGWPERIVSMLESAKKAGIRPIGIDTGHTGSSRLETANSHWVSVIQAGEAEASDRGLYVVWGGAGHSANFPFNKGVDWRLGIPSVELGDSASISVPEVRTADGRSSDFHVTLPMHPSGRPNP